MNSERIFVNGRPAFWLENLEKRDVIYLMGLSSLKVIERLRSENPEFPLTALTVGDNWKQFLIATLEPKAPEQEARKKLDSETIFGKFWPLQEREGGEGFPKLYAKLFREVVEGKIPDGGFLGKMTIIDNASACSRVFTEEDELYVSSESRKEAWGRIIKPKGYNASIYYVDIANYQSL